VFLLMLCNDRAVLGPWVNSRRTNIFTAAVITVLIALSAVLTTSVVFPGITGRQILFIIGGCVTAAVAVGGTILVRSLRVRSTVNVDRRDRENWRMPPLNMLTKPVMSGGRKVALAVLGGYMGIAMTLVMVRIIQLAVAG
jgi:hypothetical protein